MTVLFKPLPPAPKPGLGNLLSGNVRFLKGQINGRTFLLGMEDNEPDLITVRFA